MNATMVASGTKAVPSMVSSELADNIRQEGAVQPTRVRPPPEGEGRLDSICLPLGEELNRLKL